MPMGEQQQSTMLVFDPLRRFTQSKAGSVRAPSAGCNLGGGKQAEPEAAPPPQKPKLSEELELKEVLAIAKLEVPCSASLGLVLCFAC
jgi:hypothetical protein